MFYNKNTSDGCFRKTFTYNGKLYSVRVKTARDLWHKVEEKSSGYLFTQPTTGRPHTETSMKQMWHSFKQALDLDMGAQMVHGAIDPETSLWLMISRRYLRHTYATDLQSAGVPLNVAKDLLCHQFDCHDIADLHSPVRSMPLHERIAQGYQLRERAQQRKETQKKVRRKQVIFAPTLR